MKRHLIIDADILAFQAASGAERATEWEPGHWTWYVCEDEVKAKVDDLILSFVKALDADGYTLAVSDKTNFRYSFLPSYKGWRKAIKRPLVLARIKDWMVEELGGLVLPMLEGDDVCGILATDPNFCRGQQKVIVSLDKDLKGIPGFYVKSLKDVDAKGQPIVHEVSEAQADDWFTIQTIAGDATDGYGGCPGMGMERAQEAVKNRLKLVPYTHVLTRGPRKGEEEVRYEKVPCDDLWELAVSYYAAAGLPEAAALTQARAARILRYSDWDKKNRKVKLWTPQRTA